MNIIQHVENNFNNYKQLNDTFVGTKSDGTKMYAQQGERWAIFNDKAERKYNLPAIIDAANKGSLNLGGGVNANIVNLDNSGVEKGINKLVQQGKTETYTYGNKRVVKRGNLTKIYHS